MAVLACSADHYPAWRTELTFAGFPLGGFGENLSVEGASEETVCIGDVWQAGKAALQVASPRKPCSKISQFWSRPTLLKSVERSAAPAGISACCRKASCRPGMPSACSNGRIRSGTCCALFALECGGGGCAKKPWS
jgi:hypothetical protein